ncbi:hypothetical protein FB45DRAFT_999789 [Roridomyces roridus]|uniref:Uncharacterized protein n=1 Tax=Roridomyces roridus TaxID=1738132 RepID=A0AAD7CCQ7_9AGAR|nr:hypothetical protein FB45DRAFT_999789 [Roridomyces roridus]
MRNIRRGSIFVKFLDILITYSNCAVLTVILIGLPSDMDQTTRAIRLQCLTYSSQLISCTCQP